MNFTSKALIALALGMGLYSGTATSAVESNATTPLQVTMGVNFQAVARILAALIEVRYESIPPQAAILIKHADELIATPPSALQNEAERAVFATYAHNLGTAATRLKVMAEGLAKKDHNRASPVGVTSDESRAEAAQRMGEIVSACAMCHSQFRFNGTASR